MGHIGNKLEWNQVNIEWQQSRPTQNNHNQNTR